MKRRQTGRRLRALRQRLADVVDPSHVDRPDEARYESSAHTLPPTATATAHVNHKAIKEKIVFASPTGQARWPRSRCRSSEPRGRMLCVVMRAYPVGRPGPWHAEHDLLCRVVGAGLDAPQRHARCAARWWPLRIFASGIRASASAVRRDSAQCSGNFRLTSLWRRRHSNDSSHGCLKRLTRPHGD